jgi:hypothetical protein
MSRRAPAAVQMEVHSGDRVAGGKVVRTETSVAPPFKAGAV